MRLVEIAIGKTQDSKRETIQKHLGEQVILEDCYGGWCHGVLLEEKYGMQVYQIKIADFRRRRQFHYDDLKVLLIMSDFLQEKGYKSD